MSIVLMIGVCFVTGAAIRVLRRLPRLVFLATLVGTVLLSVIVISAPFEPFSFWGRTFSLDASTRVFLYPSIAIAAALAFFGPLTFERVSASPAMIIANSQGAFFFASLALLMLGIVVDSFPLAVLFWAGSLIVLMLSARPRREGRVGGAAQFLLLTIISAASLLFANRIFETYPFTPENLDLVRNAVIFLMLGLGLLLAVVPLHIWLGPLSDEMTPVGIAFLIGVVQPVGVWLLLQRMSELRWLVEKSPLLLVLLLGGVLTVPGGALLSLAERRDGRWLAYLSLVSMGQILIGLGLGTRPGLTGALFEIQNRALGLALIAGGLNFIRHHPEWRWQIVGAFAIFSGGWALAGLPPTLGMAARLLIYRDLAVVNPAILVVLIISNAVVLMATLRMAWEIVVAANETPMTSKEIKIVPYLCAMVVGVLLIALVVMGIFPGVMASSLTDTISKATFLK